MNLECFSGFEDAVVENLFIVLRAHWLWYLWV